MPKGIPIKTEHRDYKPEKPPTEKEKKIARYKHKGWTNIKIAKELKMATNSIWRITNKPKVKAYLATLGTKADYNANHIHRLLKDGSYKAAIILKDVLEDDDMADKKLQVEVARDILDRTGFGKRDKPNIHLHAHHIAEQNAGRMNLENIKDNIMELIEIEPDKYEEISERSSYESEMATGNTEESESGHQLSGAVQETFS